MGSYRYRRIVGSAGIKLAGFSAGTYRYGRYILDSGGEQRCGLAPSRFQVQGHSRVRRPDPSTLELSSSYERHKARWQKGGSHVRQDHLPHLQAVRAPPSGILRDAARLMPRHLA